MNIQNIMEALVNDALYTYEFDVTTGIVEKDIIGKDGFNFTTELGLESPCFFDELVKRSFGDVLKCRYTADSYIKDLSCASLLNAYQCGKRRLEANLYRADLDRYVRLTYFLSRRPENDHIIAYVICEDITALEKGKDNSIDLDNKNLKLERQSLTDDLNYQNNFTKILMEQMNCGVLAYSTPDFYLLHANHEALHIFGWKDYEEAQYKLTHMWDRITFSDPSDKKKLIQLRKKEGILQYKFMINSGTDQARQILAESKSLSGRHSGLVVISTFMDVTHTLMLEADKKTLTGRNDVLTQEKWNLTQERDVLTQEKKDLTQERDVLTQEKKDLTQERDVLTQEKKDLTEERNVLTLERNFLSEENIELNRAADAVHAILKAGSYVCAYDQKGELMLGIKYSTALRKLYGYNDETDFPDTWSSWINCILPEDREYVENSYLAAVKDHTGNTTYDVTYRSIRKDGIIRWQRAAGYVMRRENGSPITCYGLVMDVDEQKKAADKIEQALTQAQIANAAKTSFLARMSHDIRTPMNGILGLIEINETHADDTEFTARNRQKAKVAANYLLSLINDVLQMSKLDDPNVTLSNEAFDLKELAQDILTIIKMRAVEHGITVEYNSSMENFPCPYVWGSPLHVRQIFINILSNSIKYNKKNGRIFCSAKNEVTSNNQVLYTVTISDTGIGMSKKFLERIFEPFSREHTEVDSGYEGTGLGMSIVKQLIEKMNGTINVLSKENEGSVFTITLPFDIARKEDIRSDEPDSRKNDISGVHILLVEDNDLNIEIAETFLKDAGAIVTKAYNGQQAVYTFTQNRPRTFDVILMDVMMPLMNGYEATRKIRSLDRPDAKNIPIIAMTANAFVEDIQESKAAGMTEHLSKPLDIAKVIATISKCLNR